MLTTNIFIVRIYIFVIIGFLFVYVAVNGCSPGPQERMTQINTKNTEPKNESEKKNKIIWTNKTQGTFTDIRDNKKYKVVKTGSQIWFAENLAFKPANGDYWVFNNNKDNIAKYGYLYLWETAKRACPEGWHLPSKDEWNTLINSLGGTAVAGGKLKATGGWNSPNIGATNSGGFSALPGGNRSVGGSFYHLGDDALFWSGSTDDMLSAWKIRLNSNWDSVSFQQVNRRIGYSVRCIKD